MIQQKNANHSAVDILLMISKKISNSLVHQAQVRSVWHVDSGPFVWTS